jgi:hypothetical protein
MERRTTDDGRRTQGEKAAGLAIAGCMTKLCDLGDRR